MRDKLTVEIDDFPGTGIAADPGGTFFDTKRPEASDLHMFFVAERFGNGFQETVDHSLGFQFCKPCSVRYTVYDIRFCHNA